MILVGLTGGIGAGKSTVSAMLAERGAAIVDADQIARDLQSPGSPVLAAMADRFGDQIVLADGSPLTYGKLYLRYFGYILSGVAASLGFVWIGIDPKRRGWHDIIAKTYVIQLDDDIPPGGEVVIVSEGSKGWLWLLLWVLLAIGAPAVLFSGLWFLGPVVTNILKGFGK